jgi:hypothetical protein
VAATAYAYGLSNRSNPSINDVYVVAAGTSAALLLVAALVLVGAVSFTPELLKSYPSVRDGRSRWWQVGVLLGLLLAPAQAYMMFAVVGGAVARFLELESSLAFVTASFLLTAVAGGVGLASAKRALSWQSPVIPVACLALMAQFSLSSLSRPVQGMTDAALVTAFEQRVTDDQPATLVMAELRTRRSLRWSSLSRSLQTLREDPERLSTQVSAARSKATGYAGCSMPNLTPMPYHGNPELDLLTVLVSRGELEEPRAWLRDPTVPSDLKAQLRPLLTKASGL